MSLYLIYFQYNEILFLTYSVHKHAAWQLYGYLSYLATFGYLSYLATLFFFQVVLLEQSQEQAQEQARRPPRRGPPRHVRRRGTPRGRGTPRVGGPAELGLGQLT